MYSHFFHGKTIVIVLTAIKQTNQIVVIVLGNFFTSSLDSVLYDLFLLHWNSYTVLVLPNDTDQNMVHVHIVYN